MSLLLGDISLRKSNETCHWMQLNGNDRSCIRWGQKGCLECTLQCFVDCICFDAFSGVTKAIKQQRLRTYKILSNQNAHLQGGEGVHSIYAPSLTSIGTWALIHKELSCCQCMVITNMLLLAIARMVIRMMPVKRPEILSVLSIYLHSYA